MTNPNPKLKESLAKDPYFKLKWWAYLLVDLPKEMKITDGQFVEYCKFQLAVKNKVLMKDPVWDSYTPEEILREFFAHRMATDSSYKTQFMLSLGSHDGTVDDFEAWADKEISKNQVALEKKASELEESVSFDPSKVGEKVDG